MAFILDNHAQVCVSPDESRICVYLPSGGETVIMCKDLGWPDAKVWWYNPRNGKFYNHSGQETETALSEKIEDGVLKLQAPGEGKEEDWICIAMKDSEDIPVKNASYYEMEENCEVKKVFEW